MHLISKAKSIIILTDLCYLAKILIFVTVSEKRKTDRVTLALRQVNLNPKQFAEEKLTVSYQMFRYRIRRGRLTLDDYHKILLYTGLSFEALFPNPYLPNHQPIKLNLNPASRIPLKETQPPPPVIVPVVAPSEPEAFTPIDIYGGGLPPDDPNAV